MGALLLAACTKHDPTIAKLTAKEAANLANQGEAVIVDVRESGEVEAGIAAPAKWLPISHMDGADPGWTQFRETHPKEKQIVFYCAAGVRAQRAAEAFKEKGFQTAWFSGYDEWKAAGLPTKKP